MNSTFVQLNKKGKILKGDSIGSFVIVRNESMGFIILISEDFNFQSKVYDSWVEDMENKIETYVLDFIRENHPGWDIEFGACDRCVEVYKLRADGVM